MHPILADKRRLGIYLAAWVPVGGLLAALSGFTGGRGWFEAIALTQPLALVYAFVCLGSWSLCRAMPLERTHPGRLTAAHGVAALLSSAVWVVFGRGWAALLARGFRDPGIEAQFDRDLPIFFTIGGLLFVLAAVVHYLLMAFESSRAAERRALEMQVLAREAELRALKAQINPHFLFNSLNAIAALAGSEPAAARNMCLLLAEFLRRTLTLGARAEIALVDEMSLVRSFLAIEQVRFASRLAVDTAIEPGSETCLVPPLLLQPLVENAVNHGIAGMLGGGTVRIEASRTGGRLRISIENPFDPDRPASRGSGLGLANVRARLDARHGALARAEVREGGGTWRVTLSLPAILEEDAADRPHDVADGGPARAGAGVAAGAADRESLDRAGEGEGHAL